MNSKKRNIIVIIGALIIFLLLFILVFLPKKNSTAPSDQISTTPTQLVPSSTDSTTQMKKVVTLTHAESVSSTPVALKQIPFLSTGDWKEETYNGISFKIPPSATFDTTTGYIHPAPGAGGGIYIMVENYNGGSRREQFLQNASYKNCNWIAEEAAFSSVKALQMAADAGECQGTAGGIITVVGNKLVVISPLYYDKNKNIGRYIIEDTVVSTLKSQ